MFFSYIGIISIIIGIYVFYKVFNPLAIAIYYKYKYGELCVIKFWPLLGAFGYIFLGIAMGDSQKWMRNIVRENPKAKFIMTNFCFQPQLMIIDAAYSKEFFQIHSSKYVWTDLLFASEYFMDFGLVATVGKKWKQQRTTLAKVFHFDALKKRIPTIQEVIQEKMPDLEKFRDQQKAINVIKQSQCLTGEVVVRSFFGKKFDKSIHQGMVVQDVISSFVQDCADVSMDPFFSIKRILFGKKLATKLFKTQKEKKAMAKVQMLRSLALEMIDERIQNYDKEKPDEKKDFLDHYLYAYLYENPKDNEITKDEIVQQFITLYFAGMDTTANLTAKTLYMLPQYPDIYQRVEKEIEEVIPDINSITGEQLNRLNVTTAYIKEILRLQAPAFILGFREVTEAFTLCNELFIPKGLIIDVSFHAILRDPKNFENPDQFDIDRYLVTKELNPAYLPFGAGPRNCIGQHLAQFEAKIFLTYYLRHFKLKIDEKKLPLRMGGLLLYEPSDKEIVFLQDKNQQQGQKVKQN